MRRLLLVSALLVTAAVGVAGCAEDTTSVDVPAAVKAPPQTTQLGWSEPYPAEQPALVFGVSRFTVTPGGWTAEISVTNRSAISWRIGDSRTIPGLTFGVMLFPNDDLGELEDRNRNGSLPAIRDAATFNPDLPSELGPGAEWKGTMAAPGALPGGLWVRLSFGPFSAAGEPPEGSATEVVWFTDHAFRLEELTGEAA